MAITAVEKSAQAQSRDGGDARPALKRAISKVFASADFSPDDDLSAGLFDFNRFEDAVWFLTGVGWLHSPYTMVEFCRACGSIEITRAQLTDDVRRLYAEVVEATDRDPEASRQGYTNELARTDARMGAGKKIITYATILRQALEHGWAGREPPQAWQEKPVWKHTAEAAALRIAKGTQ